VKLLHRLAGDDGLEQENERVDGVSEAIKTEQLPLVAGESDLIDGLGIVEIHLIPSS
jgi:hypothetical protein